MSYKYKRWLQMLVREHHNFGTEPSKEFDDAINELDEAYAKAEAFDEIKGIAFWYFERMRPDFENSAEYESFYEDIRNELKEIESEAE